MLNKMKDITLAKTAKIAINTQIEKYGKLSQLSLNSKEKSLIMTLEMRGEDTPIEIKINKYIISQEGEKFFIQVQDIQISRLWLFTIAKDYLEYKKFKIPNKYTKIIKTFI